MIRILAAIGIALIVETPALAQSYCDQVKQGVATYGYDAARKYAAEHYGEQAAEAGDRCLGVAERTVPYHRAPVRRHESRRYYTRHEPGFRSP